MNIRKKVKRSSHFSNLWAFPIPIQRAVLILCGMRCITHTKIASFQATIINPFTLYGTYTSEKGPAPRPEEHCEYVAPLSRPVPRFHFYSSPTTMMHKSTIFASQSVFLQQSLFFLVNSIFVFISSPTILLFTKRNTDRFNTLRSNIN